MNSFPCNSNLLRLMLSSSWPAFPTENNEHLLCKYINTRLLACFCSWWFCFHVFFVIFNIIDFRRLKELQNIHPSNMAHHFHPYSINCWNSKWPFGWNLKSHHVDSIFIEGVLLCVFRVVNQDPRLKGPPNGALLKALPWRSKKIDVLPQSDL